MNDFAGQTVLITGASRGIGAATALLFAQHGAQVAINYRSDEESARQVQQAIHAQGGRAELCRANVGDPEAVTQMVDHVERTLGPIHVLVNNAAAFNRNPFLAVTLAEFDQVWTTNVRGLFVLSQLVARRMAERQRGAIIHVSSILAQLAVPTRTAYCASKGAVESLTRAMALDLAPYHIRVNAVSPGLIQTEAMLAGFTDPARLAVVQQFIPEKRFGAAEEIAQTILFLASDAASYINGVVIPVDGALSVREAGPLPTAG
jgi:NAD(P)-dependent dehydrogenase (short-subunit alcohol dehydrogenase family)